MTPGPSSSRQSSSGSRTTELALAVRGIPSWGWFLIFGLGCIACLSTVVDYNLPEKSRVRAIWSTLQVLTGIIVFLSAGVAATFRFPVAYQSPGLWDLLCPDRLWVRAIQSLPATRWHICTASWAVMSVLCGILLVGGLTYWLPSKPNPKHGAVKIPFLKELKEAAGKRDDTPEEEPRKGDETPAAEKPEKLEKPKPDETKETPPPKKTVTKCVIVGYTTKDGELDGLVVATVHGDELYYSGVVPASKDPEVCKDLLKRFRSLKVDTPVFPDLEVKATWLKPRLSCEVESAGVDEDEILKAPEFKGLFFPEKAESTRPPAAEGKDAKDTKDAKDAKGDDKDAAKDRASPK
jgi:hypothetical protein